MNAERIIPLHVISRGGALPANHVKRDALVSKMLQDRTTLRLIKGPWGFGKSALAREYAHRLFAADEVVIVDAGSPDFTLALDGERIALPEELRDHARLVVIDGLPWMHEERAQTLSQWIDALLFEGVEVIVTTRPSCDCLGVLQSGRLAILATDLLASEKECAPAQLTEQDGDGRAFGRKRWAEASASLFGCVPAMIWQAGPDVQRECLAGLLSETLPMSFVCGMFAMFLLESGNVRELEQLGAALRSEELAMIARDYPVFGLDSVSGDFKVAQFELSDLRRAVFENRLEAAVLEGAHPLSERVLGALFRRGDLRRGSQVIDAFCNDEQCAQWLDEQGWVFLDSGEISLVSKLLDRCSEELYAKSPVLQALQAWLAGLSGDRREACHVAQRILVGAATAELPDVASVAARIALAQFDEDAVISSVSVRLSTDEGPSTPLGFLAGTLDMCTNVEIARAFSPESADEDIRYEKARRSPAKQRVRRIANYFTEYADMFGGSRCYHLALHILAHVDSPDLRRLVQTLGCDAILRMRRVGVSTFSEALLVRDMWQSGYFGLVGPVVDRRDAKVLDGAAHMLTVLANYCGKEAAQIPWEVHGVMQAAARKKAQAQVLPSGVEEMYVRLFGGFEVTLGNRVISEGKWRKKARALFSILVLNGGRDVPRDEIFAQLWPGTSHSHALDNFYTLWANCVSKVGEAPYLERNGEYCRVDGRFVRSDVGEFEQLARHLLTSDQDSKYLLDTYAKIEVLYRGCLLPSEKGIRVINAQRDRYRALYVDAMVAATECALRAGDARVALWFGRKAMEEDQGREDVYRALMRAQIAAGQRCPAIKTYLVCKEYLQSALGLDPSIETRELYNSLVTTDPELLRLEATLSSSASLRFESL